MGRDRIRAKGQRVNAVLEKGRYRLRLTRAAADVAAAQRLRHLCFVENAGLPPRAGLRDGDDFDARCLHLLAEDRGTGALLGCCRVLLLDSGAAIGGSYAAQFYDLDRLSAHAAPMAELGRFCIHPGVRDGDLLRLIWGALARLVDDRGVGMLFGCASFRGTSPAAHADAFALLRDRHLAPARWRPAVRAPRVVPFAPGTGDPARGALRMPPLLRSYLLMGGWVSDHAVIDDDLGTLHVFTGVETGRVPGPRARALRALA